jgi:hypothetical protein
MRRLQDIIDENASLLLRSIWVTLLASSAFIASSYAFCIFGRGYYPLGTVIFYLRLFVIKICLDERFLHQHIMMN